jgi:hypothetical protein
MTTDPDDERDPNLEAAIENALYDDEMEEFERLLREKPSVPSHR